MSGFYHASENIEKGGDFCGQGEARGEEAEIGVEASGARVVVAGAEVEVRDEVVLFAADYEKDFAVGFETD
jgi:hypothetical protein